MRLAPKAALVLSLFGATLLLASCGISNPVNIFGAGLVGENESAEPTALIVDGSGSMNLFEDSETRIESAKAAAGAYVDSVPDGTSFALWSYGLNTSNSEEEKSRGCSDTSNLITATTIDPGTVREAISSIAPSGWSPIASTMKQAGESLPTDEPSTLVVVTDGEDTCGTPTICEVAKELHQSHPLLKIDAIGFLVDDPELNCAANETGGLYVTADNAEQLTRRLAASRDSTSAQNSLTGRSLSGIEIGASHDNIASAYPDFPQLSSGRTTECTTGDCRSSTLILLHWRDCDWYFGDDGILEVIDQGENAHTIDGFSVGDDASDLDGVYGPPVKESEGRTNNEQVSVRWYESDLGAGTAWRIVIDGENRIKAIVLCKCLPSLPAQETNRGSTPATTSPVNPNTSSRSATTPPMTTQQESPSTSTGAHEPQSGPVPLYSRMESRQSRGPTGNSVTSTVGGVPRAGTGVWVGCRSAAKAVFGLDGYFASLTGETILRPELAPPDLQIRIDFIADEQLIESRHVVAGASPEQIEIDVSGVETLEVTAVAVGGKCSSASSAYGAILDAFLN